MNKLTEMLPRTLLYLITLGTVLVFALVFFGGSVDPNAEYPEPVYLDVFMTYLIVVGAIAVVATLILSLIKLGKDFIWAPADTLKSMISIGLIAVLLVATYYAGDTTPLVILGYEGTEASDPFWLSISDMFISSIGVLLAIAAAMMIWSPIGKAIKKLK